MSTSPKHFDDGRVRQPSHTSAASMLFDFKTEIERLDSEQPWQAGHSANTIVKYPDLRIILIAMKAGAQLVDHRTVGRLSIHCLSGTIRVHTPDETIEVSTGMLLTLDREVPHDVFAASDATFLLTIAWPTELSTDLAGAVHQASSAQVSERYEISHIRVAGAPRLLRIDSKDPARECGLDETLADTFPCSDALSSIPDPR